MVARGGEILWHCLSFYCTMAVRALFFLYFTMAARGGEIVSGEIVLPGQKIEWP